MAEFFELADEIDFQFKTNLGYALVDQVSPQDEKKAEVKNFMLRHF